MHTHAVRPLALTENCAPCRLQERPSELGLRRLVRQMQLHSGALQSVPELLRSLSSSIQDILEDV